MPARCDGDSVQRLSRRRAHLEPMTTPPRNKFGAGLPDGGGRGSMSGRERGRRVLGYAGVADKTKTASGEAGRSGKTPLGRGWRRIGSGGWTRTSDQVVNSHLLYRLSYAGTEGCLRRPQTVCYYRRGMAFFNHSRSFFLRAVCARECQAPPVPSFSLVFASSEGGVRPPP